TPSARSPVSGRDVVPGRRPSLNDPLPVAVVMVEPATRIASVDAIKNLRRAEIIDMPQEENFQITRRPGPSQTLAAPFRFDVQHDVSVALQRRGKVRPSVCLDTAWGKAGAAKQRECWAPSAQMPSARKLHSGQLRGRRLLLLTPHV